MTANSTSARIVECAYVCLAVWDHPGIAGVSAKYRTSAEVKAAKKQAEEQGAAANAAAAKSGQKSKKKKSIAAAVSLSGRGASDYFLLEASLDGVPAEILRDHSTVRAHELSSYVGIHFILLCACIT